MQIVVEGHEDVHQVDRRPAVIVDLRELPLLGLSSLTCETRSWPFDERFGEPLQGQPPVIRRGIALRSRSKVEAEERNYDADTDHVSRRTWITARAVTVVPS
jgi:hypothetical protein